MDLFDTFTLASSLSLSSTSVLSLLPLSILSFSPACLAACLLHCCECENEKKAASVVKQAGQYHGERGEERRGEESGERREERQERENEML